MQTVPRTRRRHLLTVSTLTTLVLVGCLPHARLEAGLCRGPSDTPRARLQTLDCMISLASGGAGLPAFTGRIEKAFRDTYHDLLQRPLRDAELGLWTELYRLSTRFYPRLTTLSGKDRIPLTLVNSHHFSVPFWIRRSLEVPLGTLLHFDTHADMDGIPRMDDVRKAVRNIRTGSDPRRGWHVIAHAIHRNSMPVTGAVLAAGVREIVWAKPSWVADVSEIFNRSFFYARPRGLADPQPLEALDDRGPRTLTRAFAGQARDFFQLYYDPADNQGSHLPERDGATYPWDTVTSIQRSNQKHFEGRQPVRLSVVTADLPGPDAARLVHLTGKRFVLDVDLDYFVNIGSLEPGGDNPPSFGQRALADRSGDSHLEEFRYMRMKARALAAERMLVAERIERFGKLLRRLHAAGKRPTIISIADSTNLPFTSRREGQEQSAFVPVHNAYWVRERVTATIREVFGAAASPIPRPRPPRRIEPRPKPPIPPLASNTRERIRQALWRAVIWAVASAHSAERSPLHLWLLHAVARHGPDEDLRRAASAVASVSAFVAIEPAGRRVSASATAGQVTEGLHRLQLAVLWGSTDARIELSAVRWLATEVGVGLEPDVAADTRPFSATKLAALLGKPAASGAGVTGELVDPLLGAQTADGGFGANTLSASARATFSLLVTRGLLGLLATASLGEPDRSLLWPGYPIRRSDLDDAALRALVWLVIRLTQTGGDDRESLGLRLLRPFARIGGSPAARALALAVGRSLVRSWKPPDVGNQSLEELVRLAGLAEAVTVFGGDGRALLDKVRSRAARAWGEAAGQEKSPREPLPSLKRRRRNLLLRRLKLANGGDAAGLQPALPGPKAPSDLLSSHVIAVSELLQEARRSRPAPLGAAGYLPERRLLHDALPTVRRGLRPDVIGAWVLAQQSLGATDRTPYRDQVWQLLHQQNPDGSFGTASNPRAKMGATVRAALALATVREATSAPRRRRVR